MSIQVTEFDGRSDEASARDFLALPPRIHPPEQGPQDIAVERQLLAGTYPLTTYGRFRPFLARIGTIPLGRLALTLPDTGLEAYVGFFDCVDDAAVSGALLDAAAEAARAAGRDVLVGPVDASFWHQYRMKVAGFENEPYFGEPLNPPYYPRLWEGSGFEVTDEYVSHFFADVPPDTTFVQFEEKLAQFTADGYTFDHPTRATWDRDLADIHGLLSDLYADFPAFHPLALNDFTVMFADLKLVTDRGMVVIVRFRGEPVAFRVALPDYGVRLSHGSLLRRLPTLVRYRVRAPRYVQIYSGARPEHRGLGFAMNVSFTQEVLRRRARAVGALMRQGNATQRYGKELVEATSVHVLYRRELSA